MIKKIREWLDKRKFKLVHYERIKITYIDEDVTRYAVVYFEINGFGKRRITHKLFRLTANHTQ